MPTPVWQPGTYYAPGSLVVPSSAPAPSVVAIENPGFELGDTDWDKDAGFSIVQNEEFYAGTWAAKWDATSSGYITNQAEAPVLPGLSVTASCMVNQGASSSGQAGGRVVISWYTSGDVLISRSEGNLVDSGSNNDWKKSTVTGVAPATAAYMRVAGYAFRASGGEYLYLDQFTWSYAFGGVPAGLQFKAVQPDIGVSDASEPVWPSVVGVQVIDNTVIWEAVDLDRVVWEATPILLSGPTEPNWPTTIGANVLDYTINWEAASLQITDENCPHSKVVAIGASKVFAGHGDITRFCATNNPRDWTSEQNAGFLPTGLQQYGANDVAVLNLYRSFLAVMNSQVLQLWQIDPDPALMSIIDQLPAVGSTYQLAAMPVSQDLLYLTQLGVRSVAVTGASAHLANGDIGMPIDPLVQVQIALATANGIEPISMFYPSLGQYWLVFSEDEADPTYDYEWDFALDFETTTSSARYMRKSTDGRIFHLSDNSAGVAQHTTDWETYQATYITSSSMYDVADNGINYVAVGLSGAIFSTAVSLAASSWTQRVSFGSTSTLNCVMWTGSQFLAFGATGLIRASAAGSSWSSPTKPSTAQLYACACDGTNSIAVGADGTIIRATSPSSTTFTVVRSGNADLGFAHDLRAVVYDVTNARFIAAGRSTSGTYKWPVIVYSDDGGATWTSVIIGAQDASQIYDIETDGTRCLVVGEAGRLPNGTVTTSATEAVVYAADDVTDANDWEIIHNNDYGPVGSVKYAAGQFGLKYEIDGPSDEYHLFHYGLEATPGTPGSAQAFVCTSMGGSAKWSRYLFDFQIDAHTLKGSDLYVRSGDSVLVFDVNELVDQTWDIVEEVWVDTIFDGIVQWPWLDMGVPGADKTLNSFDIAGLGDATVAFGYNQNNLAAYTAPVTVPEDTLYEGPIPYEVTAPSISVKLVYPGNQYWKLSAINIYFNN